jgi:hypothetical protein
VANQLTGIDATAAMFEERDAPFRFVADEESVESTLWQDSWEIIERSEEQAGKWLGVRKHIPSMECIPALRDAPAIGQVQISEMAWPVLAVIDGQRTVQQIAEHLNLVLLDCCLALIFLIDRSLITIQPPRQLVKKPKLKRLILPTGDATPEAEATDAGATAANQPSGFLERLLAEAQANEQRPELTDDETQDRKRVYRYVDDRR